MQDPVDICFIQSNTVKWQNQQLASSSGPVSRHTPNQYVNSISNASMQKLYIIKTPRPMLLALPHLLHPCPLMHRCWLNKLAHLVHRLLMVLTSPCQAHLMHAARTLTWDNSGSCRLHRVTWDYGTGGPVRFTVGENPMYTYLKPFRLHTIVTIVIKNLSQFLSVLDRFSISELDIHTPSLSSPS